MGDYQVEGNCKLVSVEFPFITGIGESPDSLEIGSWETALTEHFNSSVAIDKSPSNPIPSLEYPIVNTKCKR